MADDNSTDTAAQTDDKAQTLIDTAAKPNGEAEPDAVKPGSAAEEWFWADGVKGADKVPEWFDKIKYKSVAEQAKAHKEARTKITELSEKLKGFVGAPEKYELSMPDDLKEAVEWTVDDPLLTEFQGFAKEVGMDQKTFTRALHMLAKYEYTQEAVDLQAEKKALGERADERLSGFSEWARGNLSEEQFATVMSTLGQRTRPNAVFKALEIVLSATRQASLPKEGDDVRSAMTKDDWDRAWNAKDTDGQRFVDKDPAKRKELREKLRQIVGDGDHIELVGRKAS